MADFPGQGSEYPSHVPPQHTPRLQQRKRKQQPPASVSKLHRPLTRFYCNDCKKKFKSRILANRNNNAVQHYCSLYCKIITRKVDSHSNKCKGDHGMGPCVVRRTDADPDSDGEDETKAAYYADKGKKKPNSTRKSGHGAYSKKRKRDEECGDGGHKRQRRNHNDAIQQPIIQPHVPCMVSSSSNVQSVHYPPMTGFNGYYHENGYAQSQHGYNGHYGAYPPITPVPVLYSNGNYNMPPPPVMEHAQSTVVIVDNVDENVGPPPALEAFEESVAMEVEKVDENVDENDNNGMDVSQSQSVSDNVAIDVAVVSDKVEDDDVECINDENTEDEDDLPDLTVPCNSPTPTSNDNDKDKNNDKDNEDNENEDDDLILVAP